MKNSRLLLPVILLAATLFSQITLRASEGADSVDPAKRSADATGDASVGSRANSSAALPNGTTTDTKTEGKLEACNAGTISGQTTVCQYFRYTYGSNGTPGGTWSSSDNTVAEFFTQSPFGTFLLTKAAGQVTISYTVTDGVCIGTATAVITINPAPNPGTLSRTPIIPSSNGFGVCWGSTITLSSSVSGGQFGTLDKMPFSPNIVQIDPITGVVTPLTHTISVDSQSVFYKVVDNTTGCYMTNRVTVEVQDPLNPGTISGPTRVCQGNTIQLSSNGSTFNKIWTSSDPTIASVNATTGVVTGLAPGSVTIRYTVRYGNDPNFFCPYSTSTTVTVQTCSISGADYVCNNSSGNVYTAPTGMTSYKWNISGNGSIQGATNGPSVSVNAENHLGNYTVSVTITDPSGCTSTCSKESNIFLLTPPANITVNPDPACIGVSLDLSVDAQLSSTVSWTGEGIINPSGNPSTSAIPTTTGLHTYSVTVAADNGCSNKGTVNVMVVSTLLYADEDEDGYGAGTGVIACSAPSNYVANNSDCDDSDDAIKPGATETVGDGIDKNCDGAELCYTDADDDGARLTSTVNSTDSDCADSKEGQNSDPIDCNDANADINPAAVEIIADGIDQNCNGQELCYYDADNDGYTTANPSTIPSADLDCTDANEETAIDTPADCNDANANVNPAATESCNSTDDDCDGQTDEGLQIQYFADTDGDGFGNPNASTLACSLPEGYVFNSTDCNDANANVHPNAAETCNSTDDDCDGQTDEGVQTQYFADNDGDGFGNPNTSTLACSLPEGYVSNDNDCNDANANAFPGATEIVGDGLDQNCDGHELCFNDGDNDGYTTANPTVVFSADLDCTDAGEETAIDPTPDCDDNNPNAYPGATEIVADGIDQNCNGQELCYNDSDDDGYTISNPSTIASTDLDCTDANEEAAIDSPTDCDDTNININPAATEIVGDGVDQNCNGQELCYNDADNDGYTISNPSTIASTDLGCTDDNEETAIDSPADCNDAAANINPGATEIIADGIDQNCNNQELCYNDADNDGYTISNPSTIASADLDCTDANEETAVDSPADCNDAAANINPGATEIIADGIDQNCNGQELCYNDSDDDGYTTANPSTISSIDLDCTDANEEAAIDAPADCNDANPSINPGATEIVADGTDQNCNGQELCYNDSDNDGYTTSNPSTVISTDLDCTDAGEEAAIDTPADCNDNDDAINPTATEIIADGIDQNCNGQELCYNDADNDGYTTSSPSTIPSTDLDCTDANEEAAIDSPADCGDTNININPAATEICGNNLDDDCDCLTDEGCETPVQICNGFDCLISLINAMPEPPADATTKFWLTMSLEYAKMFYQMGFGDWAVTMLGPSLEYESFRYWIFYFNSANPQKLTDAQKNFLDAVALDLIAAIEDGTATCGGTRPGEGDVTEVVEHEQTVSEVKMLVSPNPTAGPLSIQFFDFEKLIAGELRIFDATGRMVYRQTFEPGTSRLDLDLSENGLANGFYTLRARVGEQVLIRKISVVR